MHFIQHITGHNSIAHWPFIPCVPLLVIFTKGGTIPFVYFIVSVADSVPPSPMGNRVKNGPEMHLLTKIRLILYCFFGNGCELSVVDVQVFNVMYLKCNGVYKIGLFIGFMVPKMTFLSSQAQPKNGL